MQLLQGMAVMETEILQVIAAMNLFWCVYMDPFDCTQESPGSEGSVGDRNVDGMGRSELCRVNPLIHTHMNLLLAKIQTCV